VHNRTTFSCYVFATKASIDNRKKLGEQHITSTRLHSMVNFGPRLRLVGVFGAQQQISTGFASWFHYCTNVAERRSTKLCMTFGGLLG